MTFTVGVVATFTARHHLMGDFGPASQPHEHDYRVEVGLSGESLRADGTLFDIARLQTALATLTAELSATDLNQHPALAVPNPTAEVVARFLFERVKMALQDEGPGRTLAARVWESPEAYASYSGDLA